MFEKLKDYSIKNLRICYLGVTSRVGRFPVFCRPIGTKNIIIAKEVTEESVQAIRNSKVYYVFKNDDRYSYVSGNIMAYKKINLYDFLLDNGYQLNSSNLSYSEILRLEDTFNNMIEVEQKNKETAKEEKEVEEPILRELVKLGKLANEINAEEARTKIKKEIEQLGTFYVTELFKIKTTIKEELILPNPLDKLKMDCIRRISEMENEISQMKENNTLEADLQKLQRSLRS